MENIMVVLLKRVSVFLFKVIPELITPVEHPLDWNYINWNYFEIILNFLISLILFLQSPWKNSGFFLQKNKDLCDEVSRHSHKDKFPNTAIYMYCSITMGNIHILFYTVEDEILHTENSHLEIIFWIFRMQQWQEKCR